MIQTPSSPAVADAQAVPDSTTRSAGSSAPASAPGKASAASPDQIVAASAAAPDLRDAAQAHAAAHAPAGGQDAASAVAAATDPKTGKVDVGRLASSVTSAPDFGTASQRYSQLHAQLAQQHPGDVKAFDNAVTERVAGRAGTDAATGGSTGLAAAGKKTLIDNPQLIKQWESTRSAWTGKGGFSNGLTQLLQSQGIEPPRTINAAPPGSVGPNAGVSSAQANNTNGSKARDAIADRYRNLGHDVSTEVPSNGGTRRVDVSVNVKSADPRNNMRIDVESKVGRTTLNPTLAEQAAKDGQALAENGAVRAGGRALETAGKALLPVAIAGDAIQLGQAYHADGDRIGAQTGKAAAGIAGSWGGAIAGAEVGAAVGSVVPVVGTAVGGIVGGIVGGMGGDYFAQKAYEKISSLF